MIVPYLDVAPINVKKFARAVNKSKDRASACSFDQLSILMLKRCPIVRSLIHQRTLLDNFIAWCN